MEWDVNVYREFTDQRYRPAIDLLARVHVEAPSHIVDIGCGHGNVTAALKSRWLEADVVGLDSSEAMLERARKTAPSCHFLLGDIVTWTPERSPDLIFSNAALQWLDRHDVLFPRLLKMLTPNGVLAVQMPLMNETPMESLAFGVAKSEPWAKVLKNVVTHHRPLEANQYWETLHSVAASLDIWETTYLHVLTGEDAVAKWASGACLRSFIHALPQEVRPRFIAAYADAIRPHYPMESDGSTLLPFRRLFIVARR